MIVLYYLITALVVLFDQITKWLAVQYLKPQVSVPLINDVLHLTYVENEGAAFGMLKNSRWVFMIVSAVAIAALVIVIFRFGQKYRFATVAVAMILGGGIGNMIDRVRIGYVVDFIDFRLINFAVFNVADSFVTVGAALLIVYLASEMIRESKKEKAEKAAAASVDDDGENISTGEKTDECGEAALAGTADSGKPEEEKAADGDGGASEDEDGVPLADGANGEEDNG